MKLVESIEVQRRGRITDTYLVSRIEDHLPSSRRYRINLIGLGVLEWLLCGDTVVTAIRKGREQLTADFHADWETDSREVVVDVQIDKLFGRIPFHRIVNSIQPVPVK